MFLSYRAGSVALRSSLPSPPPGIRTAVLLLYLIHTYVAMIISVARGSQSNWSRNNIRRTTYGGSELSSSSRWRVQDHSRKNLRESRLGRSNDVAAPKRSMLKCPIAQFIANESERHDRKDVYGQASASTGPTIRGSSRTEHSPEEDPTELDERE